MRKDILDTDILSEYLKGKDESVARKGRAYAELYDQFTFTSVTVFEIIRGLEEKGAATQVAKALTWLEQNEQIVPTAEDYLTAARTIAKAKRMGRVVELPDSLIAAVASRIGAPLVTGNTADFENIQNTGLFLEIENWRLAES